MMAYSIMDMLLYQELNHHKNLNKTGNLQELVVPEELVILLVELVILELILILVLRVEPADMVVQVVLEEVEILEALDV
jgi:subtilase family serine protease